VLPRIDLRGQPATDLSRAKLAGVLPRAELDVQGSASLEQGCHDAEAAIRRWSRSDVPPTRDPESEGPNAACAWAGTVGPVRYWVSVSAEAGEGQLQVLVAPTVHDENLPHF